MFIVGFSFSYILLHFPLLLFYFEDIFILILCAWVCAWRYVYVPHVYNAYGGQHWIPETRVRWL